MATTDPSATSVPTDKVEETVSAVADPKGKRKANDEDSSDDETQQEPEWHSAAQDTQQAAAPLGIKKTTPRPKAGDWEAVWSAQHNAYYFYNVKSKETTWDNPLTQPAAAAPARTAPAPDLGGVDPELAYLDPSLSSSSSATGGGSAVTARFNARTGKFQGGDPTKNPEYHSDYARAKRQSSAFFDVDAWEKQREIEQAQPKSEQKSRPPTKKELEMYKAKKQEKKKAKLMARYGD